MNFSKEDTFTQYKENTDFWVVSEPSPSDIRLNMNVRSCSNGGKLPSAKFFQNHDIFHFAFEKGWMHYIYKVRTGDNLEIFSSYTYHGESIIELCTRFFGNLENDLININKDHKGLPAGEYIELPMLQLGVRKRNQPKRVFPILFKILDKGSFYLVEECDPEIVVDYIRYVITASLVSGDSADIFLESLEKKYIDKQYWMNRKFFYSTDFKEIVRDFVKNPDRELPIQLIELNTFLLQNDTNLERTIQYCKKCLNIFYKVFLNPEFDRIFQTDTSYLFPLYSHDNQLTFMGHLFFINRSANFSYENTFKGLTIKDGIESSLKHNLETLLNRLIILEEDIFRLERLRNKILHKNTKASQKTLHNINNKLSLLHKQIQDIPNGSKELISKNTERYFGFCCLNSDFN
jgi:hypothetical protein